MYDELIKNLRHDSASALQNCEFDFVYDWMLEAADAIEELQDKFKTLMDKYIRLAAHTEWIPVTKRLPELHKIVLVVNKANDIGMGTREPLWDGTVWVVPFEDVDNEFCPISHWMPLPQPPESEEE